MPDSSEDSPPEVPSRAAEASLSQQFTIGQAPITVELNRFFYKSQDTLSATLTVEGGELLTPVAPILLVTPKTGDVEVLQLKRVSGTQYVTEQSAFLDSTKVLKQLDGVLTGQAGELVYALYYPDYPKETKIQGSAHVVFDVGAIEGATEAPMPKVLKELANRDERSPQPGEKPLGTLVEQGGLPMQLPTNEVIFYPRKAGDLGRFLQKTGGKVLGSDAVPSSTPNVPPAPATSYLVELNTAAVDLTKLPDLLTHTSYKNQLYASNEGALRLLALALELRLQGFELSVNPRLQLSAPPRGVEHNPGDVLNPLFTQGSFGVDRAWVKTALVDADQRRVRAAFVDSGFSPNPDFRTSASGTIQECNVEGANVVDGWVSGIRCGPGLARGVQTVGNSFFGPRSWHGNMVVSAAGATFNNGFGVSGVAGQVMEPVLYRMGIRSYAFEMGLALRHLADPSTGSRPSVINISGGYPCRLATNLGVDFGICSVGERAATCTAITAGLATAAGIVCGAAAALAVIPVVGPIIAAPLAAVCGVAVVAATTASAACFATLIAGDVRFNMDQGVRAAMSQGIPVVSSAGNRLDTSQFDPVLRAIIDFTETNTDRWQMIPCVLTEVICAGAASSTDATHSNMHHTGSTVDLWAPVDAAFFAPMDGNVDQPAGSHIQQGGGDGGCSAAAAYLSGVIALMQANNPNLDPQNPALTLAQRRAIPAEVRSILLSTAHPELIPRTRGPLVNPRAAVDRVLQSRVPDVAALGYDTEFHLDTPARDTEGDAFDLGVVPVGGLRSISGAVHHLPGIAATGISGFPGTAVAGRAGVLSVDEDWYRARVPTDMGTYVMRVEVRSPRGLGRPVLTGNGLRSSGNPTTVGDEEIQRFESGWIYQASSRTFKLSAPAMGDDNLYKVIVTMEAVSGVQPPDRFDANDLVLTPPESRPDNNVTSRAVIFGTARTDSFGNAFNWAYYYDANNPANRLYRISAPNLNHHGPTDLDHFRIERLPTTTTGTTPCLRVTAAAGVRVRILQQIWVNDPWFGWRQIWSEFRSGSGQARMSLPANSANYTPVIVQASPERNDEFVSYSLTVDYVPNAATCE
jgi:hypothetical protein